MYEVASEPKLGSEMFSVSNHTGGFIQKTLKNLWRYYTSSVTRIRLNVASFKLCFCLFGVLFGNRMA